MICFWIDYILINMKKRITFLRYPGIGLGFAIEKESIGIVFLNFLIQINFKL